MSMKGEPINEKSEFDTHNTLLHTYVAGIDMLRMVYHHVVCNLCGSPVDVVSPNRGSREFICRIRHVGSENGVQKEG